MDLQYFEFFTDVKNYNLGVRKPKFNNFDVTYYTKQYGLIPKKSIFIIPESNCLKFFPPHIWNMYGIVLMRLGYKVFFNTKQKGVYNGEEIFLPLDEIYGFVEFCEFVIAIQTGLFDFICQAKSRFVVFCPEEWQAIPTVYQVDNSDEHIRYIDITKRDSLVFMNQTHLEYPELPEFQLFFEQRQTRDREMWVARHDPVLNLHNTFHRLTGIPYWRNCGNLVMFGCGKQGEFALKIAKLIGRNVSYFCDNNHELWGKIIGGVQVISPQELLKIEDVNVVITTPKYHDEIKKQLFGMGIEAINANKVSDEYKKIVN